MKYEGNIDEFNESDHINQVAEIFGIDPDKISITVSSGAPDNTESPDLASRRL
jgi:hypothetical protein